MTAEFEKLIGLRATVDPSGMIDLVAAMPRQVEAAWEMGKGIAERIGTKPVRRIVVVGMGGSAIAGDLVRSCLGTSLEISIHVERGYDVPRAHAKDALFVFSSYSGQTAETLSVYERVRGKELRAIAITSGGALKERCSADGIPVIALPEGIPPRASLGHSFTLLARTVAAAGAGEFRDSDCREAVDVLTALGARLTAARTDNIAAALAFDLHGRFPVIYACNDLLGAVARRWQTQLNENAKVLAHTAVFPEVSHNEICGWDGNTGAERNAFVMSLEDEDDNEHSARQRQLTLEGLASISAGSIVVRSEGTGRMARLLSTVMIGDFASVYLAYLQGTDPTPVNRIQHLKSQLQNG